MRLYRVTLVCTTARHFYVVADDEAKAARAAEKRWRDFGYDSNDGKVVKVELVAVDDQYPPKAGIFGGSDDIGWLIAARPSPDREG